ncbi:MAG: AsnC family transcriptional regulator [Deltaproteobacteria bacterium]|nr:AsnC family transcriptional regulator [Deltaproteobacteria bacterium]
MDIIDKKILNIIQKDFPIVAEPFKVVADKVGINEDEILERIARMKQEGIIRRIGAVFDSRKMGFVSTLCAARVPEERLKAFVEVVNSYAGVTHNYRRNHEYNVWFTFIAPDEETLAKSLDEIRDKTGINDVISMSATRTFKIDASFEL